MAKVEVKEVVRILRAFTSGPTFAITNHSLEILGRFLGDSLEKHPENAGRIADRVREVRDRALIAQPSAATISDGHGTIPLLHESDAGNILRDCDNYPDLH